MSSITYKKINKRCSINLIPLRLKVHGFLQTNQFIQVENSSFVMNPPIVEISSDTHEYDIELVLKIGKSITDVIQDEGAFCLCTDEKILYRTPLQFSPGMHVFQF